MKYLKLFFNYQLYVFYRLYGYQAILLMKLNPIHWFYKTPVMKRFQKRNQFSLDKVYLDSQFNEHYGFNMTNSAGITGLLNALFIHGIFQNLAWEFGFGLKYIVSLFILSAIFAGIIWWVFCASRMQYIRYFKVIRSLSNECKIRLRWIMILYVFITCVLVRYVFRV